MTSISVADELAFEGLPDEVKHLARRVLLRGRRKRPKPNHNYKVGQDIYRVEGGTLRSYKVTRIGVDRVEISGFRKMDARDVERSGYRVTEREAWAWYIRTLERRVIRCESELETARQDLLKAQEAFHSKPSPVGVPA